MKPITILYLEDNPDDVTLLDMHLKKSGLNYKMIVVCNEKEFVHALSNNDLDLIFADFRIPSYDGLSALKLVKEKKPNLPFILISGSIGEEKAIEMFKHGLTDFVNKDYLQRACPIIQRTMQAVKEKYNRKQAVKALKTSEELFRQFAENMPEVFWKVTPDFEKILYISPAYELLWQRTCESLYDQPKDWLQAIVPGERQHVLDTFLKLTKLDTPAVAVQYNIIRLDGNIRTIFARGIQIRDTNGEIMSLLGIATDITENFLRQKNYDIQSTKYPIYYRSKIGGDVFE